MDNSLHLNTLLTRFQAVRMKTIDLVKHLSVEDMVVQSDDFVSPIKWHLGHTTWFFENFILKKYSNKFKAFNKNFNYIFNSYYNSVGKFNPKTNRGLLIRPELRNIYEYRQNLEEEIENLIYQNTKNKNLLLLIELGINHEEQHQELILMDILNIYFSSPIRPVYNKKNKSIRRKGFQANWYNKDLINFNYGADDNEFSYDNEKPRGLMELSPFSLNKNFVTNQEWLEFMKSGGYEKPEFWLSDGWEFIKKNNITMPLYWLDTSYKYDLNGVHKIIDNEPVSHISFYEADAYSKYKSKRLPTEFELEYFLKKHELSGNFLESNFLHPKNFSSNDIDKNAFGNLWCWTSSNYIPYKNFRPFKGILGEYNEKFMCNQFVLKGGSFGTPKNHIRSTYRNFYYPHDRWHFSGLRLAEDLS